MGAMRACIDGPGLFRLATLVVVSIADAFGILGTSIEEEGLGDLVAFFKVEKAVQGSGGVWASNDREDHGGRLRFYPLFWLGEPAGGAVEDNGWIERLKSVRVR